MICMSSGAPENAFFPSVKSYSLVVSIGLPLSVVRTWPKASKFSNANPMGLMNVPWQEAPHVPAPVCALTRWRLV